MTKPIRVSACEYCGELQTLQSQTRHAAICLDGPGGATVRKFMQAHAVGGYAMQRNPYEVARRQHQNDTGQIMASWNVIQHRYGTWSRFVVEHCGLRQANAGDERISRKWQRISDAIEGEISQAQAALTDYDGILVINRGVRPVWNWSRQQYDECCVLEMK